MNLMLDRLTPETESSDRPAILCVDDERPVLNSLRRLLRREPYDVLTVDTPDKALRMMEERPINLLITDQRMPDMSGTELLGLVRQRYPSITCIMLTGFPDTSVLVHRIDGGIARLMTKPWNDTELKDAILHILRMREEVPCLEPGAADRRTGQIRLYPNLRELVVQLDCSDQTSASLLQRTLPLTQLPEAHRQGVLILLQNLYQLRDSMTRYLVGLFDQLGDLAIPTRIADPTGSATALLDILGGRRTIRSWAQRVSIPGGKRVLIVDDRRECRDILFSFLDAVGCECSATSSVRGAIEALQTEAFDTVLLQVEPAADERSELVRCSTGTKKRPRIIRLSPRLNYEDLAVFPLLGTWRHLKEPCSIEEIYETVLEMRA